MIQMTLEEAINYLKKTVKYSAIPGQKHLDPSLVGIEEKTKYNNAMVIIQMAVKNGELTQNELESHLGLI